MTARDQPDQPALVIVAHGERGGDGTDRLVRALAERLQQSDRYGSVQFCFTGKEPRLPQVFDSMAADQVLIYPLFMSNGYFVKQAIPKSLAQIDAANTGSTAPVEILPPFGLNSELPAFVYKLAGEAAREAGLAPAASRLLLVAHGSKYDTASRDAARQVAECIEKISDFAGLELAFLEEAPFLADTLASIEGPVVVAGLFLGEGMHGAEDVPEAISGSGRQDITQAQPLATHPDMVDIICRDLALHH